MSPSASVVIVHFCPSDTACTAPCKSVLCTGIFSEAYPLQHLWPRKSEPVPGEVSASPIRKHPKVALSLVLYVTNDAPKSLPFPDHSAIGRRSEGGFWFRQVRWSLIGSVEMAVSRGGICRNWSDRHFPSRIISSSQSGLCVSIAEIHAALIPTI